MTRDILVAGETLIDFLPGQVGPLADVETFTRRAGGSTANVAVALARLDRPPAFWTRIGTDAFGDHLDATLDGFGVPTERVERDPDAHTSLVFVNHDESADREFTLYRDGTADTRLEPGTIGDETLANTDWVHVGGVTLTDEPARSATYDLAERASDAGCTVSFDPNARPPLWDDFDYGDSIEAILDDVDVIKASPEDLEGTTIDGDDAHELAAALCERGPNTAFVTLGADGAVARATTAAPWGPAEAHHPGYAVDAVDTTGAGDAFSAAAIASLTDGESVAETLEFASAVAALATTDAGAMAALPDREQVELFRDEQSSSSR